MEPLAMQGYDGPLTDSQEVTVVLRRRDLGRPRATRPRFRQSLRPSAARAAVRGAGILRRRFVPLRRDVGARERAARSVAAVALLGVLAVPDGGEDPPAPPAQTAARPAVQQAPPALDLGLPVDVTLEEGASGPAVAALQRTLTAVGVPVDADGSFGPATRTAVLAFQAGVGLPADGIAGPATLAALRETLARR